MNISFILKISNKLQFGNGFFRYLSIAVRFSCKTKNYLLTALKSQTTKLQFLLYFSLQLRLDFAKFVVLSPPTTGLCTTTGDFITVTSPTGRSPPVLCGTLTGTHSMQISLANSVNYYFWNLFRCSVCWVGLSIKCWNYRHYNWSSYKFKDMEGSFTIKK